MASDKRSDAERTKAFVKERTAQLEKSILLQTDTHGEIERLLRKADADIQKILKDAPSDYQQWRLTEMRASIKKALDELTSKTVPTFAAGFDKSAQAGQAMIDAPLSSAGIDIAADLVAIDTRKLQAMRSFATGRIKNISTRLASQLGTELASASIGVQTPFEAAQRIGARIDGGVKRAGMIVRTELGRAHSVAAQERQTQAKEILPGLKKQWRRSSKLHSRYEHDAIDGQVRDVDKPFDLPSGVQLMHPRDPDGPAEETINCGCTSLPFMDDWTVATPKRLPVTADERAGSRGKRLISDAFDE